jgi:hypothetical protein
LKAGIIQIGRRSQPPRFQQFNIPVYLLSDETDTKSPPSPRADIIIGNLL